MARMKKRTIKSGKMLEVNYYPVNKNGHIIKDERPKTTKTKEQMQEANYRKAVKEFVRLVNCNFDNNDYFITLTYIPEFAPQDEKEADRNIANFISRVKYLYKKKGGNPKQFKCAYAPEVSIYKRGERAGRKNYHYHMFMSGDLLTADEIKNLWFFGSKGSVEHYDPERFGPEAAARYMVKSKLGKKLYRSTRNMKKPIIEEDKNALISARAVEELGRNRCDDARYWESRYPSYNFVRMDKYFNEINGCWYINVIMYKRPKQKSYYQKQRNAKFNQKR